MITRLILAWLVRELGVRRLASAELWSLDEARVGLRTDLGRKITVRGVKPIGPYGHKFDYFYLFGAINLSTGAYEFLETQAVNKTFFGEFLPTISNVKPMLLKVVLLDNKPVAQL